MQTYNVICKRFTYKHYAIGTGPLVECVYTSIIIRISLKCVETIGMWFYILLSALINVSSFYLKYRMRVDYILDKSTNY
jgi:hypothetical protein